MIIQLSWNCNKLAEFTISNTVLYNYSNEIKSKNLCVYMALLTKILSFVDHLSTHLTKTLSVRSNIYHLVQ